MFVCFNNVKTHSAFSYSISEWKKYYKSFPFLQDLADCKPAFITNLNKKFVTPGWRDKILVSKREIIQINKPTEMIKYSIATYS